MCLCYLRDSTAESFGQLSNLSLCRLHLLPLLIQLLCLLVVIYLQVLNTKHTHAHKQVFNIHYWKPDEQLSEGKHYASQLSAAFTFERGTNLSLDTTQWFYSLMETQS